MKRTIAILGAMTLLLAACSSGDTASRQAPASQAEASPTLAETIGLSDPLEGEWQTHFSCQDMVRTLERESNPKLYDRWIAVLVQDVFRLPDEPPRGDLCGKDRSVTLRLRFANGTFVTWNPQHPEVSSVPTYELIEGHDAFIGRDDGSGNWTEEAKVTYRIVGDRLTLDVQWPSPWEASTLEPGTWVRVR
ncbi:MAG TPA: hypothetical protein VFI59_15790 [Actinomycetota bacterium]|nr:hypothetical protein [Actinomycetota bacterium]